MPLGAPYHKMKQMSSQASEMKAAQLVVASVVAALDGCLLEGAVHVFDLGGSAPMACSAAAWQGSMTGTPAASSIADR